MKRYIIALAFLIMLPQTVSAVVATTQNTTETTILKIPLYAQEYTNSCEAASLRMALAYYGIKARDMELIEHFGYNPHLKDTVRNIWDDPQKQFVGFVNATGRGQGYGVYGLPVMQAILDYERKADYYTGSSTITASLLATSIREGHPVMIWGYSSLTEKPYTWKSPAGVDVIAFRGEHVRLVVGVQGPTHAPTGFYVHDSLSKRKSQFWKTADLLKNIYAVPGVTDQAIVVR